MRRGNAYTCPFTILVQAFASEVVYFSRGHHLAILVLTWIATVLGSLYKLCQHGSFVLPNSRQFELAEVKALTAELSQRDIPPSFDGKLNFTTLTTKELNERHMFQAGCNILG